MKKKMILALALVLMIGLTACKETRNNTGIESSVEELSISEEESSEMEDSSLEEPSTLEESSSVAFDEAKVAFTDGSRTQEVVYLGVDDEILGHKIKSIVPFYEEGNELFSVEASFEGEMTLKGEIHIVTAKDSMWGSDTIEFHVAEESLSNVPLAESDTRDVWFLLEDEKSLIDIGDKSMNYMDCEIKISDYEIYFAPMMVANSANLLEVISMENSQEPTYEER